MAVALAQHNKTMIIINVDYTDNFVGTPANEDIACLVTAKSLPELQAEMESALRDHIAWMREDGDPIPAEFEGKWSFDWHLSVRAMLHYTEGTVSKAAISRATGINQQQLTHLPFSRTGCVRKDQLHRAFQEYLP